MKQLGNRQIRVPGPPRDHCVEAACKKHGLSPKEEKQMLQLLGKRASIHELATNMSARPPKFR